MDHPVHLDSILDTLTSPYSFMGKNWTSFLTETDPRFHSHLRGRNWFPKVIYNPSFFPLVLSTRTELHSMRSTPHSLIARYFYSPPCRHPFTTPAPQLLLRTLKINSFSSLTHIPASTFLMRLTANTFYLPSFLFFYGDMVTV